MATGIFKSTSFYWKAEFYFIYRLKKNKSCTTNFNGKAISITLGRQISFSPTAVGDESCPVED